MLLPAPDATKPPNTPLGPEEYIISYRHISVENSPSFSSIRYTLPHGSVGGEEKPIFLQLAALAPLQVLHQLPVKFPR